MLQGSIIAASDLSARSDRAIDRAFALGRDLGLQVKVVHVLKAEGDARLPPRALDQEVRDTLPEQSEGAEIFLPVGSPPATIARVAEEQGAALIVVGVARFNHVTDYALGTAVDYLVHHARAPVLVVKQRLRRPYARILAPSDFSENSKAAILAAARLFPKARIDVVHAFHVAFEGWGVSAHVRDETEVEARAQMDAFLADPRFAEFGTSRLEGWISYGEPEGCIDRAINEQTPDLVVLAAHGESGFRKAVIGSLSSSLLTTIRPDTLIVRGEAG
ncbi:MULTISPECIES: universal stress protein [Novosphingobium]|uniref:universal stress protein n=1 Tax=Novosphingobium sp. ST904 TaxID=1684385 RepID=UPI0006C8A854|nr:universal stress protein [Novosphingobium sp. ST904]KPH66392.1 hypothetical protein ADT71_06495 [Novosphingobium sp. ST904]TCM29988.1 nucleotide-binding universal stress UspA family protein [Novosphingobium sp. ST904]